jgi:hypothetical protein
LILKKRLILLCFVFLIINCGICFAVDFVKLDLFCEKNICVSGRTGEYVAEIKNFGDNKLNIMGYKVINALNKKGVMEYRLDYPKTVPSQSNGNFSIRKEIPKPNKNESFIANLCLITQPDIDSWGKTGRTIEHCYSEFNYTFSITECLENNDCESEQVCEANKCMPLNCSYCQYPQYHKCNAYGCCQDKECRKNESCKEHLCKPVECPKDKFVIDHACSSSYCDYNKTLIDNECMPLNCFFDELLQNNTCKKINCAYDEYVFNKSCVKLNCSFQDYPLNRACFPLNCSLDSFIFNHSCKKLSCLFFQVAEQHECRIKSFLVLEVFVIFMISFLIILNIKKYIIAVRKRYVKLFFTKEEDIKRKSDKEDKNDGK